MTIAVRYDTTIRCDEPGCKRRLRLSADWRYTRKMAAAEGWSYTGMPHYRDLCPDHTRTDKDPPCSVPAPDYLHGPDDGASIVRCVLVAGHEGDHQATFMPHRRISWPEEATPGDPVQ